MQVAQPPGELLDLPLHLRELALDPDRVGDADRAVHQPQQHPLLGAQVAFAGGQVDELLTDLLAVHALRAKLAAAQVVHLSKGIGEPRRRHPDHDQRGAHAAAGLVGRDHVAAGVGGDLVGLLERVGEAALLHFQREPGRLDHRRAHGRQRICVGVVRRFAARIAQGVRLSGGL